ncbi:MAG: C39 family peptidase [PVC group bacterium]
MNLSGVLVFSQLLLLSAPSTPAPSPPSRHIIAGIPFQRQGREYCGPSTLAMVFGYYRVAISQEELADEIYRKKLDGTLNLDMLISARRHGFDADAPAGSLSLLKEYIRRDIPVIVMIKTGAAPERYHYMVVYGYDDGGENVSVHSGKTRAGTVPYRDFERGWEAAGRWMLVIEQKQDL